MMIVQAARKFYNMKLFWMKNWEKIYGNIYNYEKKV
jgi:hypothetical protein